MTHTKSEWRRALLGERSTVPQDVRRRASAMIAERAGHLPCLAAVRSVLGYHAIGAEVDPSHVLALPAVDALPRYVPVFRDGADPRWTTWPATPHADVDGGLVGASGLTYPVLALVPGVGFDHECGRLGRGAGFYDRALADLRARGVVYAVGLAYECQVVSALPSDPWDQRVDCVVTERRVLACSARIDRPEAVQ